MTVPGLICGSTASKAGISGRVSANRFEAARNATTARESGDVLLMHHVTVHCYEQHRIQPPTALRNSLPFSIPAHPISGTDST